MAAEYGQRVYESFERRHLFGRADCYADDQPGDIGHEHLSIQVHYYEQRLRRFHHFSYGDTDGEPERCGEREHFGKSFEYDLCGNECNVHGDAHERRHYAFVPMESERCECRDEFADVFEHYADERQYSYVCAYLKRGLCNG